MAPPSPRSPSPPPAPVVVAPPPPAVNIPRFYYPRGLPALGANHDAAIGAVEAAFAEFEEEKADIYEMGKIAKVSLMETQSSCWIRTQCWFFPCFCSGVRVSAVLEGPHVPRGGGREDGLRVRALLHRHLEEVRRRRRSFNSLTFQL